MAVQVGAQGVQRFLGRQLVDARLQLVIGAPQLFGLGGIPSGAIAAGENMQPLELVAGVPDIAAHRRIGPAAGAGLVSFAVAMKPQMLLDELADGVHDVSGVPQRLESFAGELGSHRVVVVEGDLAAADCPAGGGLADVMQQGRQPHDQIRFMVGVGTPVDQITSLLQLDGLLKDREAVLVDVLVAEVLVAFQSQRRKLGQHIVRQTGVHHQVQPGPGMIGADQF